MICDILLLLQTIDRAAACCKVFMDDPNIEFERLFGATPQQPTRKRS